MAYSASVNSLSRSVGERVRVRGEFEVLNVVIPDIGTAFPLTPDCPGEGEVLDHLSTFLATVCSIQPTG
ncbi:MAG: hypothetical protein AUI63_08280 [Gemmatimonadetes bacterium 13_1_40CM_2_60_3]|nr:MAG: hypothetical protein AUI63_08280 [Gemmatimonadetes bacterium 13_1_40CM_2_60_3]